MMYILISSIGTNRAFLKRTRKSVSIWNPEVWASISGIEVMGLTVSRPDPVLYKLGGILPRQHFGPAQIRCADAISLRDEIKRLGVIALTG